MDTAASSSSPGRRHSCGSSSSYLRDFSSTSSKFRAAPIKILARSITQGAFKPPVDEDCAGGVQIDKKLAAPLIDLKFVELYVKKGRQLSEPGAILSGKHQQALLAKRLSFGNLRLTGIGGADGGSRVSIKKTSDASRAPTGFAGSLAWVATAGSTDGPKASGASAGQAGSTDSSGNSSPPGLTGLSESPMVTTLRCVSSSQTSTDDSSSALVTCYRILESLYVGGLRAATNEPLLDRLRIEYLVDLSNSPSVSLPSSPNRSVLALALTPALSDRDLDSVFHRLNAFVTKARLRGKNVLLYDRDGRSEAPTCVLQYLMHYYRMRFIEARQFIWQIVPDMRLDPAIERWLKAGESSSESRTSIPAPPKTGSGSSTSSTTQIHHCRSELKYGESKKQLAWA